MARTPFWIDSLYDESLDGTGVARQNLDQGLSLEDLRGCTLVRVIISLSVSIQTPGANTGHTAVSLGIGVCSRDAFTIGVTALPSPSTAAESPPRGWVWRERLFLHNNVTAGEADLTRHVFYDIRTMRKVDNGRIFIHTTNVNRSGANTDVILSGLIRVLCKLP